MKSFIPNKIYYVLIAILIAIVLLFCFHFGIENFSLKDISLSLFVEVLSIIISLVVVDRLIRKYEKNKWSELDKRIKDRLINYLSYAYNIIFLHSKRMEEWVAVNNSGKSTEEKIAEYVLLLQDPNINDEYIKMIIEDSYLSKWYSDVYGGMQKQNEALYQDFSTRLEHNQLPIVLDLKTVLPSIATNIKYYFNLNEFLQSEKMIVTIDSISSVKNDLLKIIDLKKTDDEKKIFKENYSILDESKTDFYFEGFDENIVGKLLENV